MNIAVGSAFRNSSRGVAKYLDRIAQFQAWLPEHNVRVIAVEGDSTDDTAEKLYSSALSRGISLELRKCDHGGPVFGSTEHPERMRCLSKVANEIFEGVRQDDDVLFYIESDLIWNPGTAWILCDRVCSGRGRGSQPDVLSPLIFAGENFYDVWGFRGLDGSRFAPFPPYHSSLSGLTEVSSVGSCLVMRNEVARKVRVENDGALVGWCESARNKGYHIYVEPTLRVNHPA